MLFNKNRTDPITVTFRTRTGVETVVSLLSSAITDLLIWFSMFSLFRTSDSFIWFTARHQFFHIKSAMFGVRRHWVSVHQDGLGPMVEARRRSTSYPVSFRSRVDKTTKDIHPLLSRKWVFWGAASSAQPYITMETKQKTPAWSRFFSSCFITRLFTATVGVVVTSSFHLVRAPVKPLLLFWVQVSVSLRDGRMERRDVEI